MDALDRLGYDSASLLAQSGLRRSDLDDPDGRVPSSATGALLGGAMQQRPLKNLGMRLAVEVPIGAFPLVDYLVVTSESVGAGLRQLARYFRLMNAPYALELREDEDPVRVIYSGRGNPVSFEFGLTLCLLHFKRETEGRLTAAYASFTHRPEDAAEIEHVLGCPVHGQGLWNGFAVSREGWRLPLRRQDSVLRDMLEQQARDTVARLPVNDDVATRVRRILASRIAGGDTQVQTVARELATSARSLQRRLAAEGLSYQAVLDATRRDAASRYLADRTLSIGEVAYLLGYSEPATLHRAFKRWTGCTPQVFRSRLRDAGGVESA